MVKKEKKVKTVFEKETKTINFDVIVLKALEKKALDEQTTVSHIVNMVCRQNVIGDRNWHRAMMKEHMMQFQKHKYEAEMLEVEIGQ